eukprot:NODE_562_length_5998_cov_1.109849.p5 type:complete len:117 gc:universal NODE_562_length_5998_cov_1.109849:720-1070(+)
MMMLSLILTISYGSEFHLFKRGSSSDPELHIFKRDALQADFGLNAANLMELVTGDGDLKPEDYMVIKPDMGIVNEAQTPEGTTIINQPDTPAAGPTPKPVVPFNPAVVAGDPTSIA